MENRLLEIFKKKFKRRLDYGREYFEGKRAKMLAVIYAEMTKEIEIELKDDPDDPIEIDVQNDLDEQDEPKNEESKDQLDSDSKFFRCDICHYNTAVESSYNAHLASARHLFLTSDSNTKVFRCDGCDYVTIKKGCYDRHLATAEHKLKSRVTKSDDGMLSCIFCNKLYNLQQELWEHIKTCSLNKEYKKVTNREEKKEEDNVEDEKKEEDNVEDEKKEEDNVEDEKKEEDNVEDEKKEDNVEDEKKEEDNVEDNDGKNGLTELSPMKNTLLFNYSLTMASDQVSEVIFKPCTESNFNNMGKSFIEYLSIENQELKAMVIENNRKLQILQDERNKEEKRQLQISEGKRNNENNQQLQISEGKRNNENKNWFKDINKVDQQQLNIISVILDDAVKIGKFNESFSKNSDQRFNLKFFLNYTCKDAMNLNEFLDIICPTIDELLIMGELGYVDGISKIIVNRVRKLNITKRPFHCSNAKTETIFIKENYIWNNDGKGHTMLNNFIEKLENLIAVIFNQWCTENPDVMVNDQEKNLLYEKIYKQTRLGNPKTREKVVRNVVNEIVLDREAIMIQFGRK